MALAALLRAHGAVMNGGVDHALEVLSSVELSAAAAGYRYFGLSNVAALMERSVPTSDAEIEALNSRYAHEIPTDDTVIRAFRRKLLAEPAEFAPVPVVSHA
jgi:hypothetical protein